LEFAPDSVRVKRTEARLAALAEEEELAHPLSPAVKDPPASDVNVEINANGIDVNIYEYYCNLQPF